MAEARPEATDAETVPAEILAMAAELCRFAQNWPADRTLVKLEAGILDRCLEMGRWARDAALSAHPLAKADQDFACPRCGGRLRILRPQGPRKVQGRLGPSLYNRPYGTCDRCRRTGNPVSGAPMDWALGLPDQDISVGLLDRVCDASMLARSFADAQKVTEVHDMVTLSAKRIRELAEGEGRRLAEMRDGDARAYEQRRLEISAEESPELLVVCADGGRVQTRADFAEPGARERREESAPSQRKEAGSASPQEQEMPPKRWKESKIGVVYDAVAHPDPKAPKYGEYRGAKAKTKTYVATMQPWESFGWFLRVEAEKRGYAKAKARLFLADGAVHIRELQRLHFPETTFILDWPHAAEHLFSSAKAAFGEGTADAQAWYVEHRRMLWDSKLDTLIRDLDRLARQAGPLRDSDPEGSPRKVLHRNAYSYFPNNKDAMAYPDYRAKGWPLGSGAVEAAVKQFGVRLKSSEKFWNLGWAGPDDDPDSPEFDSDQTGAEEMLALRALYLSEDGRWQRYWEERGRPKRWK